MLRLPLDLPSNKLNCAFVVQRRFVCQKAYVEFFTSPERFESLAKRIEDYPSITYLAVNSKGQFASNLGPEDVNAVTWGVFPGKEIIQPTVVDPESFLVWKVRLGQPLANMVCIVAQFYCCSILLLRRNTVGGECSLVRQLNRSIRVSVCRMKPSSCGRRSGPACMTRALPPGN